MKETSKQNLAILSITLLFGGSLYLFGSYINPLISRNKEIQKEIEEEKLKIQKIQEYRQKSEEIIKAYSNLQQEVNKIDSVLPKDQQSAQIIAVLDKIFKDNNIYINSISFSEGSKDEYKYVEVKLAFFSTYEGFKTISQEIEKELRLMDIDKISIKSGLSTNLNLTPTTTKPRRTTKTTQPPSPLLEFNLSIFAYYLPKEAVLKPQNSSNLSTP